jgi:hypothetical protein
VISEREIQHHFVDRFIETHGEPKDGYVAGLWKRLPRDTTIEALEAAAERLIRTKKTKSFPTFPECLDAIKLHSAKQAAPAPMVVRRMAERRPSGPIAEKADALLAKWRPTAAHIIDDKESRQSLVEFLGRNGYPIARTVDRQAPVQEAAE